MHNIGNKIVNQGDALLFSDAPECESPKPEPEADLESDDDTVIIESVGKFD